MEHPTLNSLWAALKEKDALLRTAGSPAKEKSQSIKVWKLEETTMPQTGEDDNSDRKAA